MGLPSRDEIAQLLADTLDEMVAGSFGPVPDPAPEVKGHLDTILAKGEVTVRDGMLTLLGMEVAHGEIIDWRTRRVRGTAARPASKVLGKSIYKRLHIHGSGEALESGVKGTGTYMDRSNDAWIGVLAWASDQTDLAEVEKAFNYLAAGIANTARNLPLMPALDTPRLTFAQVFALFDEMLGETSRGAHEQFIFAALLEASREQAGEPGVVETKHLNASDKSAKTAADVQEKYKGQVTEAYELTANDYEDKIDQAESILRRHDLRRVHIVAKDVTRATGEAIADKIPPGADLTVLDVREEIRSMLAQLGKPHRRFALERLYRLLVDRQSNDALVVSYVQKLRRRHLVETP